MNFQDGVGRWLKPYCYDDVEIVDKIGHGTYCKDSCFTNNAIVSEDRCQLHQEARKWMGFQGTVVDGSCFKSEHSST